MLLFINYYFFFFILGFSLVFVLAVYCELLSEKNKLIRVDMDGLHAAASPSQV